MVSLTPEQVQNGEWFDMQCNVRIVANRFLPIAVSVFLLVVPATRKACADVTITQLANAGVVISDDVSERIMIDGLVVEPYSVYGGLPPELAGLFLQLAGPFAGIDLALVSHQHHEHNQPTQACAFLEKSSKTVFAASASVIDLMREKCRQLVTTSPRIKLIEPTYEQPVVLQQGTATVTAFVLSHGEGKGAVIQNVGHLVAIGGMRVLHVGDAAMQSGEFTRAGVDKMDIDIALLPFSYFQPGPGGDLVRRFLDVPHKVALHIPPSEMAEVKAYLNAEFPRVLILEKAFDQAKFSPAAPPQP